VCSLLTSLHAWHSRFLSLRKYMHSFDHVGNCQANNNTPSSLFCYACEWSNVLNCLSHVDQWPCALVALKAEHIIWHITHQLQMSGVGGDSNREICSFRSCVRVVWLSGEIRAQNLPMAFPFSILWRRLLHFPLCGMAFSRFPIGIRSELKVKLRWTDTKSKWHRSEIKMKSTWRRSDLEVKSMWNRSASEVKSKWSRIEIKVNSTWNRSESEVKLKWRRSELEISSKWNRIDPSLPPTPTPSPPTSPQTPIQF